MLLNLLVQCFLFRKRKQTNLLESVIFKIISLVVNLKTIDFKTYKRIVKSKHYLMLLKNNGN